MLYAALKILHLLAAIVWLGGMAFVLFFLRPALGVLEPPQRLRLMHAVLRRFFAAVALAAAIALLTGAWMMHRVVGLAGPAGHGALPLEWLVMAGLGLGMVLVFLYVRLRPYPRLARAVAQAAWPQAAQALADIRRWVLLNLFLGAVIVAVTLAGAVL